MVELDFHCCMCGEQNDRKVDIDLTAEKQTARISCQYCGERLIIEVESKYIVTNVDNQ